MKHVKVGVLTGVILSVLLFAGCGGGGGDGGYTPPPPAQLDAATLKANGYYVNVHTAACGSGEIRGQITAAGLTGQQTIPLTLTTAAEVPVCAAAGAGASGSGTIVVNVDTGVITSVSVTTANMSGAATSAHIHAGATGVAGAIIVPLLVSNATTIAYP
jgi:hypothetical protein